jgi:hypothetical protein
MDFDAWNDLFGRVILEGRPGRPAYFAITEAELRHLVDRERLGIADPVEDLKAALRPFEFLTFTGRHMSWERSRTKAPPPWLPFLAATTLVVDQQTEVGSLSFYQPLSDFLSTRPRVSEEAYQNTFFRWWRSLGKWLVDEDRHAGKHGFPTWESIPAAGPRSVIGHPYTQVLLRPEERRQIDDFLSEFDHVEGEYPTARDRAAAADQLIASLRRWATERHIISSRLRRILEGGSQREAESLGYILLGRLFAEIANDHAPLSTRTRTIHLVPAYDEYERILHLAAVAPSWVDSTSRVRVPGADEELFCAGDAVLVERPITSDLLTEGTAFGDEVEVRLVNRPYYVLAAREWSFWCGVDGALPDEEIYVLLETEAVGRLGLPIVDRIKGVPDNWALHGPTTLSKLPRQLSAGAAASNRQLLPRLRGGLRLQGRLYLCGGEPVLESAGFTGTVSIDGTPIAVQDPEFSLAQLQLGEGLHTIEVGGFELTFETTRSRRLYEVQPTLGRASTAAVVSVDSSHSVLTGARMYPEAQVPHHPGLIPRVDSFVKLGEPGEIGIVEGPLMARWAARLGLPHTAIEVYARSSYAYGDRLVKLPRWIAWRGDDGRWTIGEFPGAGTRDEAAPSDAASWRQHCEVIGTDPQVWGEQVANCEAILARWRDYCEQVSEL